MAAPYQRVEFPTSVCKNQFDPWSMLQYTAPLIPSTAIAVEPSAEQAMIV
jgi:hypothetical protein